MSQSISNSIFLVYHLHAGNIGTPTKCYNGINTLGIALGLKVGFRSGLSDYARYSSVRSSVKAKKL